MGQIFVCTKPSESINPDSIKISEEELQNHEIFNTTINLGDFQILKPIGKGFYGPLYKVKNNNNEKTYSMKAILNEFDEFRNLKGLTIEDKMNVIKLKHQFVANTIYIFQNSEKIYYITEYFKYGDLGQLLKTHGRFSDKMVRFYIPEIIIALEFLHQNKIIYRDLKLENILIDEDFHIKLTDWGISEKGMQKQNFKNLAFYDNTIIYAPEILKDENYNETCDWWSLGIILYRMLSGDLPFYAKSKAESIFKLTNLKIEMKSSFSNSAISLLNGLLTIDGQKRLGSGEKGIQDLKLHPYFEFIDWVKVEKRLIEPPITQKNFERKSITKSQYQIGQKVKIQDKYSMYNSNELSEASGNFQSNNLNFNSSN